jgi:hypothetical protein
MVWLGVAPARDVELWLTTDHATLTLCPPCLACGAASAAEVVAALVGPAGLGAPNADERRGATLALGSALALAPEAVQPHLLRALAALLDRSEHDALTPLDMEVGQRACVLAPKQLMWDKARCPSLPCGVPTLWPIVCPCRM